MSPELLTFEQKSLLKQACDHFPSLQICVIGDLILDRYMYGSATRISPESPVPVLSLTREVSMLGGAGNALANLVGLGCKAHLISVIGEDDHAAPIRKHLHDSGVTDAHLVVDTSRPTIVKTRFLAGHQQLLRADFEQTAPVSQDIQAQILKHFEDVLPSCQVVILSDYGKGCLPEALLAQIIERANKADIPVMVDPKGNDFSIYRGAFAVTPNKKELSEATRGLPVADDEQVEAAARHVIEQAGVQCVFATRSAEGMSVICDGQVAHHVRSAQDIEVFDVSGAGDTVIATLAAAFAAGLTLEEAARLGNVAGSVAVTKVGTAPVLISEIYDVLEGFSDFTPSQSTMRHAPVFAPDQALEQVKRWRARGMRIGFTNGCFDILHAGHVTYLNEARGLCDRLIVGLNKDSSVRVLKGDSRPIHDEDARAAVLSALGSVDMVVLFGADQEGDDNTACDLIAALQPDLYFKGGDYTVDEIPEAPTVHAYGGQVEVLSNIEGYSTTAAIKKM